MVIDRSKKLIRGTRSQLPESKYSSSLSSEVSLEDRQVGGLRDVCEERVASVVHDGQKSAKN